ncbi:hypothetical protein [Glutamicibacter sp. 0426]|uniref:hypothetical protein n=1 Tax=Glutamicibacter sp. 0426 TaxID=1913445 RepID=UPI000AE7B343|nr:hypothetical protein [Glutamicibacter sp. 0426]
MAENDPLGRNWKLWGGILAFIVVIVIAGLVIFPRVNSEPETAPPAPAPSVPVETASPSSPSNSPSASASKPASGDCPALSTDSSFPNDAPDTEWKRHPAGMLLPVNADHGPAKMDGGFWRCFSHTPTGAVLAGFTLVIDFSAGAEIDAAVESMNRQRLFEEQGSSTSNEGFPPMLGYRVMNSSDDSAIVEYLSKAGEQYAAMSVNLAWSDKDHDWRLDLTSGPPAWSEVNDPSSYTEFK